MPKLTIEADGHGTHNTRILVDGLPVGTVKHVAFQATANALTPAATIVLYESATTQGLLEKLRQIPWLTIVTY